MEFVRMEFVRMEFTGWFVSNERIVGSFDRLAM